MFQSTRPVKGATGGHGYSNTMPLVSIHAPREGRDVPQVPINTWLGAFQSTRPVKGATRVRPSAQDASSRFNPRAP